MRRNRPQATRGRTEHGAVWVEVPIVTPKRVNGTNASFSATSARVATQREAVTKALYELAGPPPALPCVVLLTRVSVGVLDAHDNLPIALKAIADAVAAWMDVDDGDAGFRVTYAQHPPAKGKGPSVRIELHPGAVDCDGCAGRGWRDPS